MIFWNKNEEGKKAGLKCFDTALPQKWINDLAKGNEAIYNTLLTYCVWCYDNSLFGYPFPLHKNAVLILIENDERQFINHPSFHE